MKKYFAYYDKENPEELIFIYCRNYNMRLELCMYDKTAAFDILNKWSRWLCDTIEKEREIEDDYIIKQITKKEVEELLFMENI